MVKVITSNSATEEDVNNILSYLDGCGDKKSPLSDVIDYLVAHANCKAQKEKVAAPLAFRFQKAVTADDVTVIKKFLDSLLSGDELYSKLPDLKTALPDDLLKKVFKEARSDDNISSLKCYLELFGNTKDPLFSLINYLITQDDFLKDAIVESLKDNDGLVFLIQSYFKCVINKEILTWEDVYKSLPFLQEIFDKANEENSAHDVVIEKIEKNKRTEEDFFYDCMAICRFIDRKYDWEQQLLHQLKNALPPQATANTINSSNDREVYELDDLSVNEVKESVTELAKHFDQLVKTLGMARGGKKILSFALELCHLIRAGVVDLPLYSSSYKYEGKQEKKFTRALARRK